MLRLSAAMVVIVMMVLVACNGRESASLEPRPKGATPEAGSPVTRASLKRMKTETGYGIAVPAGADLAALEKLAHQKGPGLEVTRSSVASLFTDEQLAFMTKPLSTADADALKASPAMFVVHGSGADALKLAKEIAGVVRDIADAAHGWVLDPETAEIYPAAAFHDHVPTEHPDIRKLIVVHAVIGGNTLPFLDTGGMRRYGLPELYVRESATGQIDQLMQLINGAAQSLLDGEGLNNHGEIAIDFRKLGWDIGAIEHATGKAVWRTRWVKGPDAAPGDDLVVELVPPSGEGTEGAAKLIDECFGFEPEKVITLKHDDPELMAAGEKARADLVKLRSRFAKGIPVEERLIVKAKFSNDRGQVEWMWADIVAFKADSLEGTLANEPQLITSLRDGQKVKVKLADVADYQHEKKGGETADRYSIEIMRKRGLLPAGADH